MTRPAARATSRSRAPAPVLAPRVQSTPESRDAFDARALAAVEKLGRAYAPEVAKEIGSTYERTKFALVRIERRGKLASALSTRAEHGGRSGLGRRYYCVQDSIKRDVVCAMAIRAAPKGAEGGEHE